MSKKPAPSPTRTIGILKTVSKISERSGTAGKAVAITGMGLQGYRFGKEHLGSGLLGAALLAGSTYGVIRLLEMTENDE